MSSMNFVATSVFFAQMAYIENLGVRNVLLSDGKKIEGGMCYSDVDESGHKLGLGDVRFWLGGSDPKTAPNRQYKDGSVVFANGNAFFDKNGNITLKGTLYSKSVYTTVGSFVTNGGKTYIDLKMNVGNTYIIYRNSTVYLPPASEHEDLEINVIFGEDSILCCEEGIFVDAFTLSDMSSEPVQYLTSYSYFKSPTNLQSIKIRSLLDESQNSIWAVVNQRGVFKVGYEIDNFSWMLFPDGRMIKSST